MAKTATLIRANGLLAALPPGEQRRLVPHMELVPMNMGQVLFDLGKIPHVFFPLGGVISKIIRMDNGAGIEAGMVGREGMVPLCLFMELDQTPFHAIVQNPSDALRMEAAAFKTVVRPGQFVHTALLRFAAAFMTQVAQSAGCNCLHQLERRYCRWLLMTHDRLECNEFDLKQEFAAGMLGVRRMSITPVARRLQQAGLLRYSRGRIRILNRGGLEARCCECYGRVQAVYDSLRKPLFRS
jgi:CRP-like cAMP-binding protein